MGRSARAMWAAKLAGKSVPATRAAAPATALGARFSGLILGIDPSLRGSGIAVVEIAGQQQRLIFSRTLRLTPRYNMPQCLGAINQAISEALDAHAVEHVALEQTIYVQNFQTAQILGAARGAAIAAAAVRGLPVFEYPPLRVKQAVCGFGKASKEQVANQMRALLNLPEPLPSDESDAAAVALCHALTWREA